MIPVAIVGRWSPNYRALARLREHRKHGEKEHASPRERAFLSQDCWRVWPEARGVFLGRAVYGVIFEVAGQRPRARWGAIFFTNVLRRTYSFRCSWDSLSTSSDARNRGEEG